MDEHTALILALQLVALCCIAAALLVYLLCRIKGSGGRGGGGAGAAAGAAADGQGRAVLVTCCDSALGLQVALRLARLGFRVLAGFRAPDDGAAARLMRARLKELEALLEAARAAPGPAAGSLFMLPLDVTREDVLHEAVGLVRGHLPAGEDGLWAVVNTAGLCYRGRLDQQENCHWDAILKHNVVGALRTARTFLPLLRNNKGRLVNLGADVGRPEAGATPGLVAFTAARYAVEGASAALRRELHPHGVRVITLQTDGIPAERLYAPPAVGVAASTDSEGHTVLEVQGTQDQFAVCDVEVLPPEAMSVVEEVLLSKTPKDRYRLLPRYSLCKIARGLGDKILCARNKQPA
ncbi:D-beta-hydroxybutyrate dehydrogenase, mitochondrial [Bacillus rossius redtenbacheri]|uniref:D-beta-hydroxybutyrate dehydrogenase, mitochondrial n=1 Tax=Bacillus rossius redtenbacheri TaxID=93214 RepID=UPI002FDE654B